MNKPKMLNKILIGLVLGITVLICLFYSPWALFILTFAGAGAMMWEYFDLLKEKDVRPLKVFGILAGWAFLIIAFWSMMNGHVKQSPAVFGSVVVFFVLFVLITQFVQIAQNRTKFSILDLSTTVFGSIYIGGFLSLMFLLLGYGMEQFPESRFQSRMPVFMAMWAAWGADVGAYFIGSFLGRTKVFPDISPNKSLEGFIGGIVASAIGLFMIAIAIDIPGWHGILLGIVAAIAGQIGDLSESAFKRELGIKDSSGVFGSHGGFMDRADSFLFTVPVVYYYFIWFCPWTQ